MKLTQLPSGLSAVITRIDLPPALADRLEALGLRVGEDIEFVRSAPLQCRENCLDQCAVGCWV